MPIAIRAALRAQVATKVLSKERKVGGSLAELEDNEYDIFVHYELLMPKDKPTAHNFEIVMAVLDQIVGYFKELRIRKIFQLLNPLMAFANILRIPITIIEYMGFDVSSMLVNRILSIIIQILWAISLTYINIYYGKNIELTVR